MSRALFCNAQRYGFGFSVASDPNQVYFRIRTSFSQESNPGPVFPKCRIRIRFSKESDQDHRLSLSTNLKRVSNENLHAASIKKIENPPTFDRFIVKKLSLRFFGTPCIYIYTLYILSVP